MQLLYENKKDYRFRRETNPSDFPVHLHNAVEVCMMLEGSCKVLYGNQCFPLEAGDVFFVFPDQPHGYVENTDTVRYLLILPLKPYLDVYYKTLTEQIPDSPILPRGSWESLGLGQLMELAVADSAVVSREVMQGYFSVLIGKLLSALKLKPYDGGDGDALRRILGYIHAHYREPISRKQIARSIGYHESYISHVFSQVLRMGLTDYIHTLRVEDAKNLLKQTKTPVTWIASELGFGSIRNFNRVFLNQTAMTPMDYRRKYSG